MLLSELGDLIESIRPDPLRRFDQIPMRTEDLLRQTGSVVEKLHQKDVVFVGDYDCASVALIGQCKILGVMPNCVHIVDFDMRVLHSIRVAFKLLGLEGMLGTTVYNVFDSIPPFLAGSFDWSYANPPYGKFNRGESVWLFIHRGIDFCKSIGGGTLIIPNDSTRGWTAANAARIKRVVEEVGGRILQVRGSNHSYFLDDDPSLRSIEFTLSMEGIDRSLLPWTNARVAHDSMRTFYGRQVAPPFPQYIDINGTLVFGAKDYEAKAS